MANAVNARYMGQNDVPWPSRHPCEFSVCKIVVAGRGAQPLRRQSVTLDRIRTTTDGALQVIPNFAFSKARVVNSEFVTEVLRLPNVYRINMGTERFMLSRSTDGAR